MRHIAVPLLLIAALAACGERGSPLEPIDRTTGPAILASQEPPSEVDATLFVFGACAFDVRLDLSGKSKTIELPGGGTITTSPGLTALVTNLATGETEEVVITGTTQQTLLDNGDTLFVATGRNLLFHPFVGLIVTAGRFTFVVDASGNLVQPPQGAGQTIDLCSLLS